MVDLLPPTRGTEEGELEALFPEAKRRARRRHWFIGGAVALVVLALVAAIVFSFSSNGGSKAPTAAPAPVALKMHKTSASLPIVVLGGDAGNDLQVQSGNNGLTLKDLGPVNQFTNNGLALSPDRRDVYVVVNRSRTLMLERVDLATGEETFVANGSTPAISQDGRFLAYGSGETSESLVVENLATGATQTIGLQRLLGKQTDLLNASIKWLGSRIVIVPGAVGNDLMGRPMPTPLKGSCSAVPYTSSCLIVVDAQAGHSLAAKQFVLNGVVLDSAVLGVAGPSVLEAAVFKGNRADISLLGLSDGAVKVTHLFSVPSALPQSFSSNGAVLFYLHTSAAAGPVSLWKGSVTMGGLTNTKMLNPDVNLAALAG